MCPSKIINLIFIIYCNIQFPHLICWGSGLTNIMAAVALPSSVSKSSGARHDFVKVCRYCMMRPSNEKNSALQALCEGNQLVTSGFPSQRPMTRMFSLTHWGRVTHICVSDLTPIGSDNGLSPCRRHAIIWTNARILLIGPLGTIFSEILIEIHTFSFKKMYLKMPSAKWRLFRLGLNVIICIGTNGWGNTRGAGNLRHHRAHYDITVMAFLG